MSQSLQPHETGSVLETTTDFDATDDREESMHDSIDELAEQLIAEAEVAGESQIFKDWLEANSKIHNYSARNSVLIEMQMPEATMVASAKTWREDFGRLIKEGETGIRIFYPYSTIEGYWCPECGTTADYHEHNEWMDCELAGTAPDKWDFDPEDEWDYSKKRRYKVGSVFDVSQTHGDPIPQLPTEATGTSELLEPTKAAIESIGHDVEVDPTEEWQKSSDGTCDTNTDPIEIRVEQSTPADTTSVLIHEAAHAELHEDVGLDTQAKEVEAEAIAYIVCEHFGIDASGAAFYLASWADDTRKEVGKRLNRIKDTAQTLIDEIEEQADDE